MFLRSFIISILFLISNGCALEILEKKHGNLKAWVIEEHSNPLIGIQLTFALGTAEDPVGQEGLTALTVSLLGEGTTEMSSQALRQLLEDRAISLSAETDSLTTTVTLISLKTEYDLALEILAKMLKNPRFESKDIERIRAGFLVSIKERSGEPGFHIGEAFRQRAFSHHPIAGRALSSELSIKGIRREDLLNQHHAIFVKNNLLVSVVGDVKASHVEKLLRVLETTLKAKASLPVYPEGEPKRDGKTHFVPFPSPQLSVFFYQKGLKKEVNSPSLYQMPLLEAIVGGNFSSRLYQQLRVKGGYTYGVDVSAFDSKLTPYFAGNFSTQGAKFKEAIKVVQQEWRKLKEQGVSADELRVVKDYLKGAFPLTLTTTPRLLARLTAYQYWGIERDHIQKRNQWIEEITLESFNKFCRDFLEPENLTFIVVGSEAFNR